MVSKIEFTKNNRFEFTGTFDNGLQVSICTIDPMNIGEETNLRTQLCNLLEPSVLIQNGFLVKVFNKKYCNVTEKVFGKINFVFRTKENPIWREDNNTQDSKTYAILTFDELIESLFILSKYQSQLLDDN